MLESTKFVSHIKELKMKLLISIFRTFFILIAFFDFNAFAFGFFLFLRISTYCYQKI